MIQRAQIGMQGLAVPLVAAGAIAALVLQLIFAWSYVGALHDPTPHELPLGVVAPPPVAARVLGSIRLQSAGAIAPTPEPNAAAIQRDINARKIYGGVIVAPTVTRLIVADAASLVAAQALTVFGQAFATRQKTRLVVVDVKPLGTGDARGLSSIYLVLSWVFGAYLIATILSTLRGPGFRSRLHAGLRLLVLAVYAILSGILGMLVAGPLLGALPGNFWAGAASGALLVFAVALATSGLQTILGSGGTLIALVLFVLLGNPSSGGIFAPEFLPTFWRAIGPWLPNAAGYTMLHNLVYFEGHAIGRAVITLIVYALAGAALVLLFGSRPQPLVFLSAEAEVAGAAAAG
jgi:hypothetical protein